MRADHTTIRSGTVGGLVAQFQTPEAMKPKKSSFVSKIGKGVKSALGAISGKLLTGPT